MFDSSFFLGLSYFEDYLEQNYSVFQPVYKYFKTSTNSNNINPNQPGLFDIKYPWGGVGRRGAVTLQKPLPDKFYVNSSNFINF